MIIYVIDPILFDIFDPLGYFYVLSPTIHSFDAQILS